MYINKNVRAITAIEAMIPECRSEFCTAGEFLDDPDDNNMAMSGSVLRLHTRPRLLLVDLHRSLRVTPK
jgi:hypothetical protein